MKPGLIVLACLVDLSSSLTLKEIRADLALRGVTPPEEPMSEETKAARDTRLHALHVKEKAVRDAKHAKDAKKKKHLKSQTNETALVNHTMTASEKLQMKAPASEKEAVFEAWYVNLKGSSERKECMDKQLQKGGMTPHRWQAVEFPSRCANKWHSNVQALLADTQSSIANPFRSPAKFVDLSTADAGLELTRDQQTEKVLQCLAEEKMQDCVGAKGIAMDLTASHGSKSLTSTDGEVRGRVISNWCSHKRLFEALLERNTTAKYFVVLEDDTILDKNFKNAIEDFVENYKNETWGSVQIDPWGKGDKIDTYKGKAIGRQFLKSQDHSIREFWGMHAWLIKKAALPKMVDFMINSKTIPIDWIPRRQSTFLAWKPGIAKNPESGKGKTPKFCSDLIRQSTISA